LRFGIPDAKLEKWIVDRRLKVLEEEGIEFACGIDVGGETSVEELRGRHDALVLATGSRVERDLEAPGRELDGVHFAMEYLYGRHRYVRAEQGLEVHDRGTPPSAAGKNVVVVGGGDTGMDCVSNALREGAADVTLLDVYPEVPVGGRYPDSPWPLQPRRSKTTYALDEGGERRFGHQVIAIEGDGKVERVIGREVTGNSSRNLKPVEGSEFAEPADLVLIAIGFSHPEHGAIVDDLGIELDKRGNFRAPQNATSTDGVFAAGDARVGQSLVVTAIAEGRRCARLADRYLRA
jgi:glutamate synthase (NADPH/NADH) small chain